jgi:hypothetical protein
VSTETLGTSKEQLARIDDSWVNFRLAVAAIGTDAFPRPTAAGWTYQSLVAHIAAWHRATVTRLQRFRAEGGPVSLPELGTDDEFNARVARDSAGKTPDAVLSELDASWDAVRAEISALTDDDLSTHDGWAVALVRMNTYDHYDEHRPELFAAVPMTPRAMRGQIEAEWRRFRRLAESADLERTSSAGWSGKAMLAHIAYWMSEVPVELPVRLEGRRSPPSGVDEQNARVATEASGLDRDRVLALLDSGYRDVVTTLDALPADGDMPFLAVRLIAGETYEHFRQRRPELVELAR